MNKNYFVNGNLVGELVEGNYFTKRNSKKHYYVKGQGYPISNKILKDLARRQAINIIVRETNSKGKITVYGTKLINYLGGTLFQELNCDEQRCYPLRMMEVLVKPK